MQQNRADIVRPRAYRRSTGPNLVVAVGVEGNECELPVGVDGLAFHAFSCEYIAHLLEVRARSSPPVSPLSLTRRQDLLELELPEADLSRYEVKD